MLLTQLRHSKARKQMQGKHAGCYTPAQRNQVPLIFNSYYPSLNASGVP